MLTLSLKKLYIYSLKTIMVCNGMYIYIRNINENKKNKN